MGTAKVDVVVRLGKAARGNYEITHVCLTCVENRAKKASNMGRYIIANIVLSAVKNARESLYRVISGHIVIG